MHWTICDLCDLPIDNGPTCMCDCQVHGSHPLDCGCEDNIYITNDASRLFKRGDQIIYVPTHAHGNLNHSDCQNGFVTSVNGDTVFCRYFTNTWKLRTKSNSEGCHYSHLLLLKTKHEEKIDTLLKKIEADEIIEREFYKLSRELPVFGFAPENCVRDSLKWWLMSGKDFNEWVEIASTEDFGELDIVPF